MQGRTWSRRAAGPAVTGAWGAVGKRGEKVSDTGTPLPKARRRPIVSAPERTEEFNLSTLSRNVEVNTGPGIRLKNLEVASGDEKGWMVRLIF